MDEEHNAGKSPNEFFRRSFWDEILCLVLYSLDLTNHCLFFVIHMSSTESPLGPLRLSNSLRSCHRRLDCSPHSRLVCYGPNAQHLIQVVFDGTTLQGSRDRIESIHFRSHSRNCHGHSGWHHSSIGSISRRCPELSSHPGEYSRCFCF